jgi:O-antigen ligase
MIGWLTIALVAWGALAFGAVYPWAYWPLSAAAAATGVAALCRRPAMAGQVAPKALLLAIGCVALAMALQLIPLPRPLLSRLSPATDALLQEYNLPYAAAVTTGDAPERWRSHALSIRPEATGRSVALLTALTLLLAGLSRALHSGGLRRLSYRIVGVGLLLALIAIIQKVTISGAEIYGFWKPEQPGTAPYGPFVNKHHFAGWMVMVLSLAMGVVLAGIARGMRNVKPDWRHRLLWLSSPDANAIVLTIVASLVMGLSVVLSLSRSGITAFALAIVVSAWLVARRQSSVSRRTVGAAYLGFVLVVAVGWGGLDAVARRFAAASWDDVGGRLDIWNDTVRVIKDVPLTGTGLNTFGEAMLEYQTLRRNSHFARTHNDYLQLAAEGGLLVVIPVMAAIVLFFREVRRRFREGADDLTTYWIRVGATTGLLAIALQEFVDFSLQMPGNAILFTVLAAIAIHRPATRHPRPA